MWTSTAASGFGDRMIMLAVLALYGTYANDAQAAAYNARSQFWFVLPYVVLSIAAGWLADRLPRKWLLLLCDQGRAGLLLAAVFLIPMTATAAVIPEAQFWQVDLMLLLVGCCAATFGAVRNAIVPELVPRPQLQAANAVILSIAVVFGMIALIVGPYVINTNDRRTLKTALLCAFALYFISGLFFAFLKPTQHIAQADADAQGPDKRSFRYGIRYVWQHPRIITLILLNALIWAVAALVYSALPAIGKINFGLTDDPLMDYFTLLGAVLGIGMLAGAVVVAVIRTRRESPMVLFVGMAASGLCTLLVAVCPFQWLTLALAFGVGFFGNMAIIATITLIQSFSPGYVRGRVMGITAVIDNLAMVLIYLLVWQVNDADARTRMALFIVGPLMILVGGFLLFRHFQRGPMTGDWGVNAIWRMVRFFSYSYHRLETTGKGYVPSRGPVILAANHTVGLDPFLIQSPLLREVRWLMTDTYNFRWADFLWKRIRPIVLKKDAGRSERVREIIAAVKQGDIVGIFPEGGLQRDSRELAELQPGIVVIQRRTGAPIIPVWIHGTPQARSMIWHFFRPSSSSVSFGPAFVPDADATPDAVLAELRRRMEALQPQSMDHADHMQETHDHAEAPATHP